VHVGHQLAAGEFFGLSIHLEVKDITVGDGIVKRVERIPTSDVLDIDYLFFRLAESVGLEMAHLF